MTLLRSWLLLAVLLLLFPLAGTAAGMAHAGTPGGASSPAALAQPCQVHALAAPGSASLHGHDHAMATAAATPVDGEASCCAPDEAAAGCGAHADDGCDDCTHCPGAAGCITLLAARGPALLPAPVPSRGHWPALAGAARAAPERLERPPRG
jgi:hypothetical protein